MLKQARYRAPLLPIARSVGRTTTRRPGSIWATMVSGALADKAVSGVRADNSKKERLKPLFFMLV
jgi:hypothetical protein